MLNVATPHPYPGSITSFQDKRWRVRQHVGSDAILDPSGNNRAHSCRAPLAALVDPDAEQLNDEGLCRAHADALKWINNHLRPANDVIFDSLKAAIASAAHEGECPRVEGLALAGLLRRLGWERDRHPGQSRRLRVWTRCKRAETSQ